MARIKFSFYYYNTHKIPFYYCASAFTDLLFMHIYTYVHTVFNTFTLFPILQTIPTLSFTLLPYAWMNKWIILRRREKDPICYLHEAFLQQMYICITNTMYTLYYKVVTYVVSLCMEYHIISSLYSYILYSSCLL